tara:strand:+ start:9850 stop:11730 length:1881 start_codon:yes stop_codon:yes gene_type:complete
MANPAINFAGFLYDDSGDAVSGATINLYDKNTSTTSRASTTTDSNGAWSIAHTTAGEFDVQITSGSSKRRIKFDDKIHLSEVDTEVLNVRGNEGQPAPMYWFADEGDDAGDRWLFNAAAGGVFTMGNDLNTQGTYVAHVTITPNATVANSTFAVAGNLTVGNALTVTGTTTLNGSLVLGDAAADTLTVGATLQGASPLTFEGGTSDGYETTFAITDPTADRTITFPNLSGTVQLSGNPITGTTIDASTDFTIGNTVITDGVITDSTGLQLAANLDIDGTVDISGDLTLSAGGDGALVFATAGENSIKIPDNQGSALIIEEANNAYMTFVTTDSSEAVSIAKTLTLSTVAAAGTDTDKFLVLDSSGNVDYRTGTQVLSDIGGTGATALDDIGTGDAAASLVTTVGNITIDAQATDADVIIKVDDNGSAVTAVTFDGSAEGDALFVNNINVPGEVMTTKVSFTDGDDAMTVADGGGVTFAQDVTMTDGKGIIIESEPADDAYTGIYGNFANATGSTITKGQIVYMTGTANQVAPARANAVGTMPAVAMAIADVANGATGNFLMYGFAHDASAFISLTIGGEAYVSDTAAGALDATAPADDGEFVQIVGIGMHGDKLFFNPQLPMVEIA